MSQYQSLPTLAGKAKIAAAISGGSALSITHMAVGDGGGLPVTPLETQAALVHEVWRGAVTSVTRDATHSNQVVVEATIPLAAGPFMIRELGLYDADGVLIAVGSHPQIEKTALSQGSGQELGLTFVLVVDTAAQITIILDAKPQSDWEETDTTSLAYIRNKPELPGVPPLVPPDRIIEARLGLTGGGDLSEDRWFDIDWSELDSATGLSPSDLVALRQAAVGGLPTSHRKATLQALAQWILAQVVFPAVPSIGSLTAGVGLAGGGAMTSDRTVDISWPELAAAAVVSPTDIVALFQGEAHRRASISQILDLFRTLLPSPRPDLILEHRMPAGTDGGMAAYPARTQRAFNTVVRNAIGATLNGDGSWSLAAGDYYIDWYAVHFNLDRVQPYLRNITTGTDLDIGPSYFMSGSTGYPALSRGPFSLAQPATVAVQIASQKSYDSRDMGATLAPYVTVPYELFAQACIWKVS